MERQDLEESDRCGGTEKKRDGLVKERQKDWGTEKKTTVYDSRYSTGPTAVCRSFITVETQG